MANLIPQPTAVQPAEINIDEIIHQQPKWIQYLVGAYPQAKINKMTILVLKKKFLDIPQEAMMQAVEAHSDQSVYWPTIADLRQVLKSVGGMQETAVEAEIVNLSKMRHDLFEDGYRGVVDPDRWYEIWHLLRFCKRFAGAENLTKKYKQFTGQSFDYLTGLPDHRMVSSGRKS